MLRDIIIISSSGIVLFSKDFVNVVSQPRLTGPLIKAIMELSTSTIGQPVSYMALDKGNNTNHHAKEERESHNRAIP